MPPRIPLFQCLKTPNAPPNPSICRAFNSTSPAQASTVTQRRRHQDPYAIAQAKARKAANKSRQEVLKKERAAVLGDPVRGVTTEYVRSFDTVPDLEISILPKRPESAPHDGDVTTSQAPDNQHLNYFLNQSELEKGLEYSKWLSTPSVQLDPTQDPEHYTQEKSSEDRLADRQAEQQTAEEALKRISNLSLGSSKDRHRVNVQRCVSDFGRHNTDSTLERRPQSIARSFNQLEKTPRVGPDTGSSEVQIAILTAKIRALADFLETRGSMDKVNKRNLRLLVHRRAKLLKYLHRKERGGPRFQNAVKTLGLTGGTWKGQITIMGPLGGHSPVRLAKLLGRKA